MIKIFFFAFISIVANFSPFYTFSQTTGNTSSASIPKPMRAGICKYAEDYKYSSANFYKTGVDLFGLIV